MLWQCRVPASIIARQILMLYCRIGMRSRYWCLIRELGCVLSEPWLLVVIPLVGTLALLLWRIKALLVAVGALQGLKSLWPGVSKSTRIFVV